MVKTFTTLTIDTDTRDLLRNLAGDIPVAEYLRNLTGSDKGPEINIDQRLTAIESMLRQLVPEKEKDIRGLSTSRTVEDVRKEEQDKRLTAPIVCLCGSTRFTGEMLIKQWELTKQGNIVVSWCALPDGYYQGEDKTHIGDQEGVKEIVDEVHKRKIDLCDKVFVLNIDGYIGESTASEIAYAEKIGKPIEYWQSLNDKDEG